MRLIATTLLAALASAPALAAPAYWTDWTGTSNLTSAVVGDLTVGSATVSVTYSGAYLFAQTTGGTNYWATKCRRGRRRSRCNHTTACAASIKAAPTGARRSPARP